MFHQVRRFWARRLVPLAAVAAVTLGACGSGAAPASAPAASPAGAPASSAAAAAKPAAPIKLKVGTLGVASEIGFYLAQEQGYFKDAGLDVEFVLFKGGADEIPPLTTGQIDFGAGISIDPGLFNAVISGIPLKVVAPHSSVFPDAKQGAVVVRKDLIDSGKVKGPADLKGMTIAAGTVLGTTAQFNVELYLRKGNLTASDVNFIPLGFPNVVTTMSNKGLDAGWLVEPFISEGSTRSVLAPVAYVGELVPSGAISGQVVVSPELLKKPDVVQRFITAFLRGQRDYYKAVIKKEGSTEATQSALIKNGVIKDAQAFAGLAPVSLAPNGEMDTEIYNLSQDFFLRNGSIKAKIDPAQLLDKTFIQAAVQQLGPMSR